MFVLYKPRMETKTAILWLGPIGLLLFGLLIGFVFVRKQRAVDTVDDELSQEEQAELEKLLKRDNK